MTIVASQAHRHEDDPPTANHGTMENYQDHAIDDPCGKSAEKKKREAQRLGATPKGAMPEEDTPQKLPAPTMINDIRKVCMNRSRWTAGR